MMRLLMGTGPNREKTFIKAWMAKPIAATRQARPEGKDKSKVEQRGTDHPERHHVPKECGH